MRTIPSLLALRAFEAAARLENFSLAAEELRLTPSAISHQVRALEGHFTRPLFVRHNRRVELTADGRRLLGKLSAAFDAIEVACAELRPAPKGQSLAVHCAPSFASKWLGPRLPAFLHLHPAIGIRLTASAEPLDLLRREDIDLVIAYGAGAPRAGVRAEPLGMESITALATPAMAAGIDPANPASLLALPRIESSISPVRWADWLALNGLALPEPRAMPSFDRGALTIAAAVQGIGVALETTRFAQEELATGALVEIGQGRFRAVQREVHFLCYRSADKDLPKIKGFRDWLLAQSH